MPNATTANPFDVDPAFQSRLIRAAFAAARPFLSAALGVRTLGRLYGETVHASFEAGALEALDIGYRVDGAIPATGPTIFAANHPTGVRDGLVLLEAVRKTRSDVRIVANHLLARIPELAASCFFVDPFGGAGGAARSRAGLRAAHGWLRRGGALIIFPAGEVAWRSGSAVSRKIDSPWHVTLGRLAMSTGADIVPVHVDGRNSRLFYTAGLVHPVLRTLLLGRELLLQRGTTATVHLGARIHRESVCSAALTPAAVTARVRLAVDRMQAHPVPSSQIVGAVAPELLAHDLERLPASATLVRSGPYDVVCADTAGIPNVLREIGRLREVTFRAIGEGTGRSIDLDQFDSHYRHLFVWNRARREIAGAYRIGATDVIASRHGVGGLYTHSLFHYDDRLLSRIGPALELGRSFVRGEYQRRSNTLLLLWKGIGRVVSSTPRCRSLFGAVSISGRYQDSSQFLLRAFLTQRHGDPGLAALVQATKPPVTMPPTMKQAADIDELETLVRQLERTQGIPVLLRQYMRLNATLLGFNVDPAFGDALDALMMVDVARLPGTVRQRYLGVTTRPAAA